MPPSSDHWLGTDHMGVDMVSLLVAGLRSSLHVGFLAGIVATIVGTLIGVYGGYKGGLLDDILTWARTCSWSFQPHRAHPLEQQPRAGPQCFVDRADHRVHDVDVERPRGARAVVELAQPRSREPGPHQTAMNVRHRDVAHPAYLLSYIFMVFICRPRPAILSEASISMLGLGPYDSVSLGKILNDANRNEALTDGAWWAFAPAMVLITVIAFSLYVLNTSMEGIFNPRLRK